MESAPIATNFNGNPLENPGTGNFIYGWPAGGGTIYRYAISNAVPDTPASFAQARLDDTPVAVGGTLTDTTSIRLQVRGSDPDGDTVRVQVELRSAGTAFTSPVNVTIDTTVFFQSDVPVWTNQTSMRLFMGLRTDTGTLPVTNNDTGRRAFGATVVSMEFVGSAGRLLGDSTTTRYIGDSFAYTLVYYLVGG